MGFNSGFKGLTGPTMSVQLVSMYD